MSILDKSANKEQLIDILNSMKFPIMGAGGGFAPIGTINFFDASVAPQGWLACDGSIHNISDYPDLATFYASVHGASNFYGGNGTTTFAVPDLRGEFLRGTGTNGHANQGSGANVGVHQDGTEQATLMINDAENALFFGNKNTMRLPLNPDSVINLTQSTGRSVTRASSTDNITSYASGMESGNTNITSRPTNTSFLICVKATVAGDPNAHQYSTDEQIVGTDIDGSLIYEKTITGLNIKLNWTQQYAADSEQINPLISNVKDIYKCDGVCVGEGGEHETTKMTCLPIHIMRFANGKWVFRSIDSWYVKRVTIQYTKTS